MWETGFSAKLNPDRIDIRKVNLSNEMPIHHFKKFK